MMERVERFEAYGRWRLRLFSALDARRYTIEYVDRMVEVGALLCDACDDAAILTEAKVWPTGIWEVWGFCAAGNRHSIRSKLIPIAERRGQMHGAAAAIVHSRPAWAKILADDGYEPYQVEIRKPL